MQEDAGIAADMVVDNDRLRSLLARHEAFWNRATGNSFLRSVGVFAPSVPVALPQRDGSVVTRAERLTPDMVDPVALIEQAENWDPQRLDATLRVQGQYLISVGLGDQMPSSCPLGKIPWIEAMLGCPLKMTEGQIWNEHYPGDPEEMIRRGVNLTHNPWFQLYLEFLRQLQSRLGTRYPVSANTLLRGTSDLAAAVMGVQKACLAWIDRPAFMARLMRVCTDALLMVVEAGYQVLEPYVSAGGTDKGYYPSIYALLAPGPVVSTQADHSSLISPAMYAEQILPYDLEVIRSCPYSVFHLHNCGLHVAPSLIEVPELDVIEVMVDPYPVGERKQYEIEVLRTILAKKSLILDVSLPSLEEGEWLLTQLPRQRLCFNARFDPETFARLPVGLPGSEVWSLG